MTEAPWPTGWPICGEWRAMVRVMNIEQQRRAMCWKAAEELHAMMQKRPLTDAQRRKAEADWHRDASYRTMRRAILQGSNCADREGPMAKRYSPEDVQWMASRMREQGCEILDLRDTISRLRDALDEILRHCGDNGETVADRNGHWAAQIAREALASLAQGMVVTATPSSEP